MTRYYRRKKGNTTRLQPNNFGETLKIREDGQFIIEMLTIEADIVIGVEPILYIRNGELYASWNRNDKMYSLKMVRPMKGA